MQTNEKDQNNGTWLDVLMFMLRKYFSALLTVMLSAVCLYFIFYFFAEDISAARCKLDRIGATTRNEAVFSGEPMEDESFINFNGSLYIGMDNKRINCDLLMVREGEKYSDNLIGFGGALAAGECALSKNLLSAYGISVGDVIEVRGTSVTYRVAAELPASAGIDDKYLHEGIALIGYSEELCSEYGFSYLSFVKDGDSYMSLDKIIYTKHIAAAAESELLLGFVLLSVFSALVIILWELLIGRRKYSDLSLLATWGMKPTSLFLRVFGTVLLRYFVPALAIALIWFSKLSYYGVSYILPMLLYLAIYAGEVLVCAVIIYRRVHLCRMKRR